MNTCNRLCRLRRSCFSYRERAAAGEASKRFRRTIFTATRRAAANSSGGRADESGTKLLPSNASLAGLADIIFSTVTANQARVAAEATAPHLKSTHLYADLNSVSPGLKQAIAQVIEASGARFVEVAVMAPVPPYGHRVPLLTGGNYASGIRKTAFAVWNEDRDGRRPMSATLPRRRCAAASWSRALKL